MIKAITLIQPWAWAIFHAGKSIENRTWLPSRQLLKPGDWLAIHAGVKWSQDDVNWIERKFRIVVPAKSRQVFGTIVGVCRFVGVVSQSPDPWFFGPCGWQLSDARAITPIPHRGALGLWTPNEDAQERLAKQVGVLHD